MCLVGERSQQPWRSRPFKSVSPHFLLKSKQMKSPKLTKAEVEEVIKCWEQGYGSRRIAWFLGINERTIEHILLGETYTQWTGGRLACGRRRNAVWRYGTKTLGEKFANECEMKDQER